MESIQIFLKLDSLFKAKLNVWAKTIQFISQIGLKGLLIGSKLEFEIQLYILSYLAQKITKQPRDSSV